MLYINSVAAVTGPTDVSPLLNGAGCKSILQYSYLEETGNENLVLARKHQELNTAELATQAAKKALERSGFSLEDIGLILADSTSPHELIPSEAQRVARCLGHKVASYDIGTGGLGMPGLLEPLRSWKKERLAKPVLCVSVHAPTLTTTIAQQKEGPVLGDAACAFVVSLEERGFLLEQTSQKIRGRENAFIRFPVNGTREVMEEALADVPQAIADSLAGLELSGEERILGSSFGTDLPAKVESGYGLHGESFGAGPLVLLEESFANMIEDSRVVIVSPGCGVMSGACILRKVG